MFITGIMQIKPTKERLTREKATIFINIYMHMSSQERSKTQRSGQTQGIIYVLTKEKEFGLQGMTNCEEVMRKYMEEVREDKGYFSKVC